VRSSQALRWPSLNASAQAQRGANAGSNFAPSTQSSLGVDAQWEVDLFGATRAEIAAA
jgi:outer membrane protein TolC